MRPLTAIVAVSATALLLVACGQKPAEPDRTEGPVVSAPEAPGNAAVDTTPTQNEQGVWSGKATKGGAEVTVSVDYKGAVNPQ